MHQQIRNLHFVVVRIAFVHVECRVNLRLLGYPEFAQGVYSVEDRKIIVHPVATFDNFAILQNAPEAGHLHDLALVLNFRLVSVMLDHSGDRLVIAGKVSLHLSVVGLSLCI